MLFGRVAWFLTSGHVRKGPPAPCVCSSKFGCRTIHILSILTFLDHALVSFMIITKGIVDGYSARPGRSSCFTRTQDYLDSVGLSPQPLRAPDRFLPVRKHPEITGSQCLSIRLVMLPTEPHGVENLRTH